MRPASSNISASIIPGLSLKSAILASPFMTASAASLLQSGHNEGILLGTPVIISVLSQLLSSRPGAQDGYGNPPLGRIALMFLENSQTPFDAARKTRAGRAGIGAFTSGVGFRARRDGLELRQMRTPGRLGPVFYIACQPASRALCCGFARKFTKPTSQPLTVRRMSTLHSSN